MNDSGITLLFRNERIYFAKSALINIGKPEYIHLLINEKDKQLFIQGCEKDKDSFVIGYGYKSWCVYSKLLLKYLAHVVGVPFPSDTLNFSGTVLEDKKTVFVDLKKYTVVEYDGEYKDITYHGRYY